MNASGTEMLNGTGLTHLMEKGHVAYYRLGFPSKKLIITYRQGKIDPYPLDRPEIGQLDVFDQDIFGEHILHVGYFSFDYKAERQYAQENVVPTSAIPFKQETLDYFLSNRFPEQYFDLKFLKRITDVKLGGTRYARIGPAIESDGDYEVLQVEQQVAKGKANITILSPAISSLYAERTHSGLEKVLLNTAAQIAKIQFSAIALLNSPFLDFVKDERRLNIWKELGAVGVEYGILALFLQGREEEVRAAQRRDLSLFSED